jgi:PST family polysaccharide transporter
MSLNYLKKYTDKYKHLSDEIIWITIGQFSALLGGGLLLKALTTLLHPKEYGQFFLITTIGFSIQSLFFGPLQQSVIRYYYDYKMEQKTEVFVQAFKLIMIYIIGLIAILLILCIYPYILFINTIAYSFILISIVTNIFYGIVIVIFGFMNVARERKRVAVFQVIDNILKILLLAFFFIMPANVLNVLMYYFVETIIMFVLVTISFRKRLIEDKIEYISKVETLLVVKKLLKFSVPFCIWGIFSWIQTYGDSWLLNYFFSQDSVGLFRVAQQIAFIFIAIQCGLIGQFANPIIFQKFHDENIKSVLNILVLISFVLVLYFVFIVSIVYIFSKEISVLFTSSNYTEISRFYIPVMVGTFFYQLASQILIIAYLYEKPQLLTQVFMITAVIGLTISYFGIKFYGFNGLFFAFIVKNIIVFITTIILVNKIIPKNSLQKRWLSI